ncbi:MAG: sugar phosphate isomerase/epimerase family protein [Chloroflexota bacterium]
MKLGADLFSLRFNDWNAFDYLEYAHKIGLDVVMYPDPTFLESLDEEYLARVKAKADALGIEIQMGMDSICETSTRFPAEQGSAVEQLQTMLRVASQLGSPILRCLLGSNADRHTEVPFTQHLQNTIDALQAVRNQAVDLGIKFAVENHAGDMLGYELKALVEAAGTDFVGVCIDSGNPLWVGESPHVTLDHVAPYVVTSHIRDTAVWSHPQGAVAQWVAMGDGNIDIEGWSRRYMAECSDTVFMLEIISTLPPKVLNYLEPEYWAVYAEQPAGEFARFLALVANGAPYTMPAVTASWSDITPELQVAMAAQQRLNMEKSVNYCRTVLGI